MELTSHKAYAPGDDLRHLDWNVYGRLDQKLVKTFRAEREAPLHVIVDTSASMGCPAADAKLPFAAGVAASLAYVSLRQRDPVRIVTVGDDGSPGRISPLLRHPRRLTELQAFLTRLEAKGPTRLGERIDWYLRTTRLPGMAVVLSDFLVPPLIYQTALERLQGRGYHIAVIRLIGAQERDPSTLPRRVRLRDVETGRQRVVDLSDAHRARYAETVHTHLTRLKQWCESRTVRYIAADTGQGVERFLLSELPRAGFLQ